MQIYSSICKFRIYCKTYIIFWIAILIRWFLILFLIKYYTSHHILGSLWIWIGLVFYKLFSAEVCGSKVSILILHLLHRHQIRHLFNHVFHFNSVEFYHSKLLNKFIYYVLIFLIKLNYNLSIIIEECIYLFLTKLILSILSPQEQKSDLLSLGIIVDEFCNCDIEFVRVIRDVDIAIDEIGKLRNLQVFLFNSQFQLSLYLSQIMYLRAHIALFFKQIGFVNLHLIYILMLSFYNLC